MCMCVVLLKPQFSFALLRLHATFAQNMGSVNTATPSKKKAFPFGANIRAAFVFRDVHHFAVLPSVDTTDY